MDVLVLNAGSSSLKASVVGQPGDRSLAEVETERPTPEAGDDWTEPVAAALDRLGARPPAVGHRVVHGGSRYTSPTLIDAELLDHLEELRGLAPLHNAPALSVIAAARRLLGEDVPQVACFDTAFHASLPASSYVYPLPWEWHTDWGIRRYGFHGLSVEWAAERAAVLLQRPAGEVGIVVAHLGSGCSATAVWGGKSVDTSMGMTPLEGLMMGSRAGSVDPGILLELLRGGRLSLDELDDALQRRSGLRGVSGLSGGAREVEAAAASEPRARLALDLFVARAAAGIAALSTTLPRLDALVFTGGIGEHSSGIRGAICRRISALGVSEPGPGDGADAVLSRGQVAVLRVAAREDVVISRQVASLVSV